MGSSAIKFKSSNCKHRAGYGNRLSRMPTTAKHFTTPIWTVWSMR